MVHIILARSLESNEITLLIKTQNNFSAINLYCLQEKCIQLEIVLLSKLNQYQTKTLHVFLICGS